MNEEWNSLRSLTGLDGNIPSCRMEFRAHDKRMISILLAGTSVGSTKPARGFKTADGQRSQQYPIPLSLGDNHDVCRGPEFVTVERPDSKVSLVAEMQESESARRQRRECLPASERDSAYTFQNWFQRISGSSQKHMEGV